jgi:hypothetical protein
MAAQAQASNHDPTKERACFSYHRSDGAPGSWPGRRQSLEPPRTIPQGAFTVGHILQAQALG